MYLLLTLWNILMSTKTTENCGKVFRITEMVWSKRQGFDPRVAMAGADDEYGGYSPMRVISGGINLTF